MTTPDIIHQLVQRFEEHKETYRSGKYNETQLRREFLDPFFEALGWDVFNKQGYAEMYKDVIHEDSLEIEGENKAPDYAFRVGGQRKFFVEAKKPAVKIETDIHPAFQLRRYAWSAKLPLSILSDFEELAIYDCRAKPDKKDKASTGRVKLYSYKDYIEKWDEIANIFSREAVLRGSFDAFAEGAKLKKGTAEVDDAFLAEIERWRDLLATNIAIKNESLSVRELNYAVQMTIDRIVFLRICEDRGVERDEQLKEIGAGSGVYEALCQLFKRADTRYNSGLFHFSEEKDASSPTDSLTLTIQIDDKPLKDIIKNLYYPESPYVFREIPADILGQVYERFLGKVIRLTAGHRARVEEKPEVRKAGGVYYTPTYIVEYIVENTVGRLVNGKLGDGELGKGMTPKEVEKLRILDPACGSGTFSLGAYQYLLDWHLKWYMDNDPEKWAGGKNPAIYQTSDRGDAESAEKSNKLGDLRASAVKTWRLTTSKKKEILLNNIYGVDIDPQAVEVTKLSLLLKVLEGESHETIGSQLALFQERVLPDLGKNIKCGNSLIGNDYYEGRQLTMLVDEEERYRVNAFDWKAEFPQVFTRSEGGFDAVIGNPPYGTIIEKDQLDYFNIHYQHQDYQKDLYLLFLERYESLIKPNHLLGVIISNTWLQSVNLRKIRQYLTSKYSWIKILHLTEKAFKAVVDTHVLIFQKTNTGVQSNSQVIVDFMKNKISNQHHLLSGDFIATNGDPINIVANPVEQELSKKINSNSVLLENLFSVYNGIKPFEVGKGKPPQTEKIAKEQPYVVEGKAPDKTWKPLLRGGLINRYVNNWANNYWVLYGEWLAAPRDAKIFEFPQKVMVRQTGDSIIATLIESGFIARNNMHIILPKEEITINNYRLEYLLGIMNSKLMDFAYELINPEKGEALAEIKKKHVEQLPIRPINFDDPADKARHDKLVSLVERMLALHKQSPRTPQEQEMVKREIESTDMGIDGLVYELYGLSEEEIRIVEGR